MSFTTKDYATAIAPKVSACFSIMGSVFIITDILKSKEKMGRTYSRILLVMSMYDFCTSVAQGMSTWPIPEGSGRPFASGTTFTCSFQGWFTQLGVGAPMYNCSLSFYYLIVIAFAFTEQRVKQFEWFMHGIPLLFSISTATAGLPLTLYNNAYLWCWIAALPGSCENGTNPGGQGPCIRGHYAWVYRWAIYYGPIWFCVLTITINMTVVSYLVWAKERASLKFRFGHRTNIASSSAASDGGSSTVYSDANERAKAKAGKMAQYFTKKQQKKQKQKERAGLASQVFWQAFYYVLGFYITWITPTALRMLQTIGKPVPYWVLFTMSVLLPLQGFFNFLVYVRPRVVQYQNRHPEYGLWNAMSRAIRRTITVLHISESRAFNETELQDIEALDPCYALQCEKEGVAQEKRRSQEGMSNAAAAALGGDDNPQLARNSMDQRRLDELKLLEQDDPSFYEGVSSRRDYEVDMEESDKKSLKNSSRRTNGSDGKKDDCNQNEGPPDEIWQRPEQSAKVAKPILQPEPAVETAPERRSSDTSSKLLSDDVKEMLQSNSEKGEAADADKDDNPNGNNNDREDGAKSKNNDEKGEGASDYAAMGSSELYLYPEFCNDPDFFFL